MTQRCSSCGLAGKAALGYGASTLPGRFDDMKLAAAWLRIPFWQRVVAGFVLGALAGWAMGPAADVWFGPSAICTSR